MGDTIWYVYLVRCSDDSLYCGITTDLRRRLEEHNSSPLGARYTRSRRPVTLAWYASCSNRGAASREEYRLKKLSKEEKERLCCPVPEERATGQGPIKVP